MRGGRATRKRKRCGYKEKERVGMEEEGQGGRIWRKWRIKKKRQLRRK